MTAKDRARSLLIVDDDVGFAESVSRALQPEGIAALCVNTPERAVAALHDPPEGWEPASVAVIDLHACGDFGMDLIRQLQIERPGLICVVMMAGIDTDTAVEALRRGAYDCLDKAGGPSALCAVLDRCYERAAAPRERITSSETVSTGIPLGAGFRGKSSFLVAMSHELRTPLNAIIGFSEMMMREMLGALGNEQYRAYAADIHESGTHLLRIINDILDLSKAEAGKLELYEDVFDIQETIRSLRRLLRPRLLGATLTDRVSIPDDLPPLRGDERKIKQVLLNLLSNAVKFTPPGGSVDITADYDPTAGLTVTVTDTGIGIAANDLTRILEPFEQVDSKLNWSGTGAGLGLPLAKAIMELHGGSLRLSSNIGVGTAVSITFPPERAVIGPELPASRDAA